MLDVSKMSYWEKSTYFTDIDYLIVGSGIVGLSTAIALKEKDPAANVLVIDRGVLPTGASTKNAGFACFGSPTELLSDLTKMDEKTVIQLIQKRWLGLQRLLSLCGTEEIEHEPIGSYELFTENETPQLENCSQQLDFLNSLVKEAIGLESTYSVVENTFGFKTVPQLIKNKYEGQINTGKMMRQLYKVALNKGVNCLYGVALQNWEETGDSVLVNTSIGEILTKRLLFATNGFSKQLLPQLDIQPARAQVLITKPLKNLPWEGSFHYQEGFYYFRNVGNRVLLGGGRNLHFEQEETTEITTTENILSELTHLLKTVILPDIPFEVETSWAGIMGVGKVKSPIVKKISPKISVAVRLGGMGVAMGSLIGQELAEITSDIE